MDLKTVDQDLKQASKDRNELVLSALRNLKAEINNTAIEKRRELTDDELLEVVRRKVKQHKDSIESFEKGERADLVSREQQQMEVLLKYLPKQMDESEVRFLVKQVISETSATPADFGKVMKEALGRAAGRTDGSIVSKIVKEELK